MRTLLGTLVLSASVGVGVMAAPTAQASAPLAVGDLLAGDNAGNINHYGSDGILRSTISVGSSWETGACQDNNSGDVYQTNFQYRTITQIAADGTVSASSWASLGLSDPESCVVAPNGNVLVGGPSGNVVALNSSGSVVFTYPVGGRSDWISLDGDTCTLNVAVEAGPITRYNICTNSLTGSLTTTSGMAYQNEPMPNGDLLVAAGADVEEVNSSGVVRTYTVPGSSVLFSLAIAADGKSFWVGDLYSGRISRISISTGSVLQTLTQSGAGGLLVYGPVGGYVAMGDSYSAGEGLAPYLDNSGCDRSSQAYGPELDTALDLGTFTFAACSGAVTQDFFATNHNHPSQPAQISQLKKTTTSVTFTIGGNDVGFVEVLKKCIHDVPLFHWGGYGCSKNKRFVSQVNSRIAALDGSGTAMTPEDTSIVPIQTLLKRIHQLAPNAFIAVAGYPALFGSSTSTYTKSEAAPSKYACDVGSGGSIDYQDAQWVNSEGASMDNAISRAVAAAQAQGIPVSYVDAVPSDFATHGLCDSGVAWINGLSLSGLGPWPGSFHPTATGQSSGYEAAFSGLPSF